MSDESHSEYAQRLEGSRSGNIKDPAQFARFAAPMLMFLSVRWDLHTEEERRKMVDQMVAEMPTELLVHTVGVVAAFAKQQQGE